MTTALFVTPNGAVKACKMKLYTAAGNPDIEVFLALAHGGMVATFALPTGRKLKTANRPTLLVAYTA